jgi:hypothetical protein
LSEIAQWLFYTQVDERVVAISTATQIEKTDREQYERWQREKQEHKKPEAAV